MTETERLYKALEAADQLWIEWHHFNPSDSDTKTRIEAVQNEIRRELIKRKKTAA